MNKYLKITLGLVACGAAVLLFLNAMTPMPMVIEYDDGSTFIVSESFGEEIQYYEKRYMVATLSWERMIAGTETSGKRPTKECTRLELRKAVEESVIHPELTKRIYFDIEERLIMYSVSGCVHYWKAGS